MERLERRKPGFSCLDCIYRSDYAIRVTENQSRVYYCLRYPPFREENREGFRKWHRVEVTHEIYCGEYIDRFTAETYEERWHKWVTESRSRSGAG